jgi:hypothetical protein
VDFAPLFTCVRVVVRSSQGRGEPPEFTGVATWMDGKPVEHPPPASRVRAHRRHMVTSRGSRLSSLASDVHGRQDGGAATDVYAISGVSDRRPVLLDYPQAESA